MSGGGGAVGRKIQIAKKRERERTSGKMCQMDGERMGRDLHYDKMITKKSKYWLNTRKAVSADSNSLNKAVRCVK